MYTDTERLQDISKILNMQSKNIYLIAKTLEKIVKHLEQIETKLMV